MEWQDAINGALYIGGGITVWKTVLRLLRDRLSMGVHWTLPFYFFAWGMWNIYYHIYLSQWFTLAAGINITLANLVWFSLLVHFAKKERNNASGRPQ